MPHKTIPVIPAPFELLVLTPTMLSIKPSNANGMLNQLNQPKKGINPIKNPIIEKIPIINPAILISLFLSFFKLIKFIEFFKFIR